MPGYRFGAWWARELYEESARRRERLPKANHFNAVSKLS